MIGRADIEGSKSYVAMNAWQPQASYPCGNFSDTSCYKLDRSKGSRGPAFAVRIRTENLDQASFCPFALREVSNLPELALGHLRYRLADVPPQSNSPPLTVLGQTRSPIAARRNADLPTNGREPTRRLDDAQLDQDYLILESLIVGLGRQRRGAPTQPVIRSSHDQVSRGTV